jgi:hypothetical protein
MSEERAEYKVTPEVPAVTITEEMFRKLLAGEMTPLVAPRPKLDELFGALALAQAEISAAVADKENTHFGFKYADLDSCWEACRKPLTDNELSIIQIPSVGESGAVNMETILGHSSGQSISSHYSMHPDKGGPQALGSCMTYLRRYMLCAMVGISQEDDDANMATADPDDYVRISKTQVDEILVLAENLFAKSADAVVERMLAKVFELSSVKDIPADLFDQAKTLLENQANREKKAAKPKAKPKAGPDVGDGPDSEVPGT